MVEQSLPTPEICGSNPNIGKILSTNCTLKKKIKKIKKKRPIMAHFKKKILLASVLKILGQNTKGEHKNDFLWKKMSIYLTIVRLVA